MEIWFATTNPGKLREVERALEGTDFEVKSLSDVPVYTPPDETGKTFEENARLKAKSLRSIKNEAWVMAEDSGLVVEGLNGFPGIHSARYAGPNAKDIENIAKVLKMMSLRCFDQRAASFKTCICLISPDGNEQVFDGELKGEIAKDQKGTSGFGYDPIFIPEGETRTLAEFSTAEKNQISHRSRALKKMLEVL